MWSKTKGEAAFLGLLTSQGILGARALKGVVCFLQVLLGKQQQPTSQLLICHQKGSQLYLWAFLEMVCGHCKKAKSGQCSFECCWSCGWILGAVPIPASGNPCWWKKASLSVLLVFVCCEGGGYSKARKLGGISHRLAVESAPVRMC